jgi:hypothetical protein
MKNRLLFLAYISLSATTGLHSMEGGEERAYPTAREGRIDRLRVLGHSGYGIHERTKDLLYTQTLWEPQELDKQLQEYFILAAQVGDQATLDLIIKYLSNNSLPKSWVATINEALGIAQEEASLAETSLLLLEESEGANIYQNEILIAKREGYENYRARLQAAANMISNFRGAQAQRERKQAEALLNVVPGESQEERLRLLGIAAHILHNLATQYQPSHNA